jgi:hypothetical protein
MGVYLTPLEHAAEEIAMTPNAVTCSLLLLGLLASAGCVVRVPPTAAAPPPAPVYTSSWVEQIKLRIEQPSRGPRVAAKLPTSWHQVELSVGRLDGSVPVRKLTLDPFESQLSGRALNSLVPGDDYWVQVDLVHIDAGREAWVVGSGRLGGDGRIVRFHAGPNGLPIEVKPVVAGGRIDSAPTPLRRRTPSHASSSIIFVESTTIISGGSSDDDASPFPETDTSGIDWVTVEDEEDTTTDHETESDDSDDEGVLGDWLGASSALKRSGAL